MIRVRATALATILIFVPQSIIAMDADSLQLANALGGILASEELCGLQYNQDAIANFITEKVRAEDLNFAASLNYQTIGSKVMFRNMSTSEKTAHCAQTTRVARSYGFIE